MLKTTSGSSSRTDLSNIITFSLSQSHATVPLRSLKTIINSQWPVPKTGFFNYSSFCLSPTKNTNSRRGPKKSSPVDVKETIGTVKSLLQSISSHKYCIGHKEPRAASLP
jgi:hypothetical protein